LRVAGRPAPFVSPFVERRDGATAGRSTGVSGVVRWTTMTNRV
jgi:hypothetical protein